MNDLFRWHGISKETFYRWRKKYGVLQVEEAKRLRQLEEENRRLKRVLANGAEPAGPEGCAGKEW